jgi:crossover junction endodeoxyribonuclease RusA
MPYLEIVVEGSPVPQGSFRHIGNGRIIAANPKLNAWRQTIADQVSEKTSVRLIDGFCRVDLVFTLPRPKSVPKSRRARPTTKPDLDKLVRAALDAISLPKYVQLLTDDSLVTDLHAAKRYADHRPPGVRIFITYEDNELVTKPISILDQPDQQHLE